MEKMLLKRKYYNGVDYFIDDEAQTVTLSDNLYDILVNKKLWKGKGFKKIGGSSIGDVLEVDGFKSQFLAWARITWLSQPILDRKYVDAGIAIEPMVIEAIEKKSGKKVETYDPYEYEFDYFKNDDVLGGLPDGYMPELDLILELKTTGYKNLEKWDKWGIPGGYLKQAQLYAYLNGSSRYSIVATYLHPEDYANPAAYPINDRIIKNFNFNLDKRKAEDDVKKVKEWYYKYTSGKVSPRFDVKKDSELLEWLRVSNEEEQLALEKRWISLGKLPVSGNSATE